MEGSHIAPVSASSASPQTAVLANGVTTCSSHQTTMPVEAPAHVTANGSASVSTSSAPSTTLKMQDPPTADPQGSVKQAAPSRLSPLATSSPAFGASSPPRNHPPPVFAAYSAGSSASLSAPAARTEPFASTSASHAPMPAYSAGHGQKYHITHSPNFGGSSTPSFSNPPPKTTQAYTTSPQFNTPYASTSTSFSTPATAAATSVVTSSRNNPMSMSSLLSHEASSSAGPSPAASSVASTSSSSQAQRVNVTAPQPMVTASPYAATGHDRHEGWSFAKPQPRLLDSSTFSTKSHGGESGQSQQSGMSRFEYYNMERKRQASEGGGHRSHSHGNDQRLNELDMHRRNISYDFSRPERRDRAEQQSRDHRSTVSTSSGHSGGIYQGYPPSAPPPRQEGYYSAPRPAESHGHHHHHHHHHSSSHSQSRRINDISSLPPATTSGQNAWNKAFATPAPWLATTRNLDEKPMHSQQPQSQPHSQTSHHKRKRPELEAPPSVPPQSASAPPTLSEAPPSSATVPASIPRPPSPVAKRAPGPLFTEEDLERIALRPELVTVDSSKIYQAVEVVKDPRVIGRFTWDPESDTAQFIESRTLQAHIGHSIEVVIDGRWLKGAGRVHIEDPKSAPKPAEKSEVNGKAEQAGPGRPEGALWSFRDLEPLRRRRVWGTDVYTDDSDVLAMCLHSGWLRVGPHLPSGSGAALGDVPAALNVTLKIAPRLIRYQATLRGGIKSRSWGNSHDGASYQVSKVVVVDQPLVKGRRQAARDARKRRRTTASPYIELNTNQVEDRRMRLTITGEATLPYTAEVAARLARALVTTVNLPSKQEDAEMIDADADGGGETDDSPIFKLSMIGYTLSLLGGSQRHELTADASGAYSLGKFKDVAADKLEFGDEGVVLRADDFTELARFAIDRISWRAGGAAR